MTSDDRSGEGKKPQRYTPEDRLRFVDKAVTSEDRSGGDQQAQWYTPDDRVRDLPPPPPQPPWGYPVVDEWHYEKLDDAQLNSYLSAPEATLKTTFVRVRISYCPDQASDDRFERPAISRLVVECDTTLVSRTNQAGSIAEMIQSKSGAGMGEFIAKQLDAPTNQLCQLWSTKDVGDFAKAANTVAGFQDSLHDLLIGDPAEKIASLAGAPDPAGLGFVAEQIPIDSIDGLLGSARVCIEILGIAFGVAAGVPVLACACSKALAHDVFHRAVVTGIKSFVSHQLEHSPSPASGSFSIAVEPQGPTPSEIEPPGHPSLGMGGP